MKLMKKKVSYVGKDNKERTTYNFILVFDNGYKVPIKAVFDENYSHLCILAENLDVK